MRISEILEKSYLCYIALLLPVAGFLLTNVLHAFPMNLFTFIIGVACIGIVSASATSYTKLPTSPLAMGLVLFDGPFWVLLGHYAERSVSLAITETALIECIAILGGIFLAATFTRLPITGGQRAAALVALGIPLLGVVLIMTRLLEGNGALSVAAISAGIFQGMITQYSLTKADHVLRDAAPYILISVLGWMAALMGTGILEAIRQG